MKTDKFGVFDKVSVVVDTTTGERVSQYFTRLGDAKRKAKHFNAGLGYQRYEAHEMHVSPKVSTFAVLDKVLPGYACDLTTEYPIGLTLGSAILNEVEITLQNVNTGARLELKNVYADKRSPIINI
jgi:hypothetical protein